MKTLACFFAALLAFAASAVAGGTVNNLTQAELESALVGGGTVLFGAGGSLTLSSTIVITNDTTLDANGYAVTISGGNSVRLFQITGSVTVVFKGMTLADGRIVGADGLEGDPAPPGQDAFGAGLLNQGGNLVLADCMLSNHFVTAGNAGQDVVNPSANTGKGGDAMGAAIQSLGGSLSLTNCIVAGNAVTAGMGSSGNLSSASGNGGQALGGAIYSAGGSVHFESVTLTNNRAIGGAPGALCTVYAARGGNGSGGALFLTNSVLWLNNSRLLNNSAAGGEPACIVAGPLNAGSGQGLGGALFLASDASATVGRCLFSGNSAMGGNGNGGRAYPSGAGRGGAVFNAGGFYISTSTFSGCSSAGGSQTRAAAPGQGGAIYSTNRLIIEASTFVGNAATGGNADGGGLSDSSPGAGEGGAIWSSGLLAATNFTLTANRAGGGYDNAMGPPPPSGGPAHGGGLCVGGGTAIFLNATIAGNRADGGANLVYPPTPPGPAQGGGLCSTNATVTIRNSIVADSPNGGDVWGPISDAGYNICSDGTAAFSAVGSLNQVDPRLGALSNNGGPTATMGLLTGSPALDAIPSGFPPADQRAVARPQGTAADIGAFEAATNTAPATPPLLNVDRSGQTLTLSFTAEAGRTYRLLSSSDLVGWVSIGTNSALEAGVLEFVETINSAPRAFYRVVTP